LSAPAWLWIAVTVWAAFAQTIRNAAQRHLTAELGTLGATLVRFLYGLPYALLWLYFVHEYFGAEVPSPSAKFAGWVLLGALSQTTATALLLKVMQERNFALGVAYSKTEILQVAIFGLAFLGDPLGWATIAAVACGTAGVLMIAPPRTTERSSLRIALLGLASGAGFALSAVGYRGAALALEGSSFLMAAAYTLVWAQFLSTLALGGWLVVRERAVLGRVLGAWKLSQVAGFMGAAASAGWFTAFALQTAAHVRTLGLIELVFSYLVSLRIFREKLSRLELAGMALLAVGMLLVTLPQADAEKKPAAPPPKAATKEDQARERYERASLLMRDRQFDAALSEVDKAISLVPSDPENHVLRGFLWYEKMDEHTALRSFEQAIRLGTKNGAAYNSAAWILSTSKDNSLRDGKRALEWSRQANQLTGYQDPSFIDTLAAAHAEVGEFDEAVRQQQRALDFPQFSWRHGPGAKKRLELYKENKPYRAVPKDE
jgi:drug/metabolite transporter (DMT)-like permease